MTDLAAEVERRKAWFLECQVRSLNLDFFRGLTSDSQDPRLGLISEPVSNWDFPGHLGVRMKTTGRLYLDSREPVWSADERVRRDTFAATCIGRINNWFGYRDGRRLAAKLAQLRTEYEASAFASNADPTPTLNQYGRREPAWDTNALGQAISRATLAARKPWLIPELYNVPHADPAPIENWIVNLETFLADFETELVSASGAIAATKLPFDPAVPEAYRVWIRSLIGAATTRDAGDALKVRMLTRVPAADGKSFTFKYDIAIEMQGHAMGPVRDFRLSRKVGYWTGAVGHSIGEVYVSKANSDMGLCHVLRAVYLFGALPAAMGADADLAWRVRTGPDATIARFFDEKAKLFGQDAGKAALEKAPDLPDRLRAARAKLTIILEETAQQPLSAAPAFSPLAQEVIRQALHSYKFWLDEPLRTSTNEQLVKARTDTGIAKDDETVSEMEYWSENHYIMFASSEFLAGQLWEADEFQPGKEFLPKSSKQGIVTGRQRKERGRARVLKWLNNRLMFGWTEFHSSGYYREHLWALLNLYDFSLDKEVRTKAQIAIDLLLFDLARFHHRGGLGAAGGRSQFKSKSSGWDGALGDVIEMLFGTRGVFMDGNGEMGAAFATSTYRPPEVLLEIGVNPPAQAFTDRTRISITFEEAPKFGIGYSQESDQKSSVMEGYAPKRARHFPFLGAVNREIARTHFGYGAAEDDIVFWWGTSAFLNKQVVRGTFDAVEKFGLERSGVFASAVTTVVQLVGWLEKLKTGAIGGLIGTVAGGPLGAAIGAGVGILANKGVFPNLEQASDDLSFLLEGSTRTRANILTYRNADVMLSSAQNFRPGQMNFQSNTCMASLNLGVNVFVTSGFADIDISGLATVLGGGLLGGALGNLSLGLLGGLFLDKVVLPGGGKLLANHEDGPGWWSGYWSAPMVVQHGPAAILAFDFNASHRLLATCRSHAWFPRAGFDRVEEMRCSAYDDANFPLFDITDIGPKGFWLFGRIRHPSDKSGEPAEAYIGVFSNQRPEWLTQDSEFYEDRIEKEVRDPIEKLADTMSSVWASVALKNHRTGIADANALMSEVTRVVSATVPPGQNQDRWIEGATAALRAATTGPAAAHPDEAVKLAEAEIKRRVLRRIWPDPLPSDLFAGRDWHVGGKNVWIIQVGSRAEFGDFETFKARVSGAGVRLDDAGDLECSYDIPRPDGGSDRLSLAYGDRGSFELNGSTFQTDLYPRFENPFLRGGRVEWGQRDYVIEYRGKTLLHDLSDFNAPVRREEAPVTTADRNAIKALVLFFRTEDEDMDAFTVATADVVVGCTRITAGEIVAAGPVAENTYHDAEWIFLSAAAERQPDMTLALSHPASSRGDSTPHWTMSFKLFALMGDRVLRPCSLEGSRLAFKGGRRTTTPIPFSVALREWRAWEPLGGRTPSGFWMLARPGASYQDGHDVLVLADDGRLWHQRHGPCPAAGTAPVVVTRAPPAGTAEPDLSQPFFAAAVSLRPGDLRIVIQSGGALFARRTSAPGAWTDAWTRLQPWTHPPGLFGLPDPLGPPAPIPVSPASPVTGLVSPVTEGDLELWFLGADGHLYTRTMRDAWEAGPWNRVRINDFTPMFGLDFVVAGDTVLVVAVDRSLWLGTLDDTRRHVSAWERVGSPGIPVQRFTATVLDDACQVVALTPSGLCATTHRAGEPSSWLVTAIPGGVAEDTRLASAVPDPQAAQFFTVAANGRLHALEWRSATGWDREATWMEVAVGVAATLRTDRLAAVSRVRGLVEVFAENTVGALMKAWWS